jgi:hypothetical protein
MSLWRLPAPLPTTLAVVGNSRLDRQMPNPPLSGQMNRNHYHRNLSAEERPVVSDKALQPDQDESLGRAE